MHGTTVPGSPDIPWEANGTSFAEYEQRTGQLLAKIEAGYPGASDVGLALLADQVAELRAMLGHLARAQIAVNAIYLAGAASRGVRRRLHAVLRHQRDHAEDPRHV